MLETSSYCVKILMSPTLPIGGQRYPTKVFCGYFEDYFTKIHWKKIQIGPKKLMFLLHDNGQDP
jgi:hypothetical protein